MIKKFYTHNKSCRRFLSAFKKDSCRKEAVTNLHRSRTYRNWLRRNLYRQFLHYHIETKYICHLRDTSLVSGALGLMRKSGDNPSTSLSRTSVVVKGFCNSDWGGFLMYAASWLFSRVAIQISSTDFTSSLFYPCPLSVITCWDFAGDWVGSWRRRLLRSFVFITSPARRRCTRSLRKCCRPDCF